MRETVRWRMYSHRSRFVGTLNMNQTMLEDALRRTASVLYGFSQVEELLCGVSSDR